METWKSAETQRQPNVCIHLERKLGEPSGALEAPALMSQR